MSSARTGAVGTVIGVFVPLSPVVACLIVIAARVERDGIAPAGSPGAEHREKGREQTGARRARRVNPDPPRAEIWRALGLPGLADASGRGPDAVRQVAPEMKAVFVPVLQSHNP